MKLPPIIHKGSVKNIRGNKDEVCELIFEYTDGHSVFDWGTMPDLIPDKGRSLAFMADAFFSLLGEGRHWKTFPCANSEIQEEWRKLQKTGMSHHGLGPVDDEQNPVERESTSRYYKVRGVKIYPPSFNEGVWDYSSYKSRPTQALVPLEVVFRFGIPAGSSFLERSGDANYLKSLGVHHPIKEGDLFDIPIIEYSSKLETSDRYLTGQEAQKMACLTDSEFKTLHRRSVCLAYRLKQIFQELELVLWDGKFEFAFGEKDGRDNRDFMLVDSIGPDELRLTYQGIQLSKQNLRNFYKGGAWHKALVTAKKWAVERGEKDWKKICIEELGERPGHVDDRVLSSVSMMYKTLAQKLAKQYFNIDLFPNAWSLDRLIRELK